jgi:sec-independent protein translocase protein TatC
MNKTHSEQTTMGILEHLRELRRRLLFIVLAIIIGACGSYYYADIIFDWLCAPFFKGFGDSILIGTSPAEAWLLKVKVALFMGAVTTSPFSFFQLWLFISPALYRKEKLLAIPFTLTSSLLFIGGSLFCYYVVLPLSFQFFYEQFQSIGVTPTIKIGDHLSLTLMALLGFGAIFQLPIATFILARMGIIDHRFLIQWYRHAVLVIFILSAIITPPDVITQFLMAGPLLILYAVSIAIARYSYKEHSGNSNLQGSEEHQ